MKADHYFGPGTVLACLDREGVSDEINEVQQRWYVKMVWVYDGEPM